MAPDDAARADRGTPETGAAAGSGEASDPGARLLNRDLSWLDFNERVLALAEDPRLPSLERAKFLAIFSANLDEFFQVRVAGLKDQVSAGVTATSPDGMTPSEQLRAVRTRVDELIVRHTKTFLGEVVPELEAAGIRFSNWADLDADDQRELVRVFDEEIFPILTPLAVDPAHPFPYISNLSLNLAVTVADPATGARRFARLKVPPLLPRFVVLPDGERFVPLEQVIAAHLDRLFPGMEVLAHHPFRVTRKADLSVEEDEAEDLLEAIESGLQALRRKARVVRLEVGDDMSAEVLGLLQRELELEAADVYAVPGPLDLSGLWALYGIDRPELKDEPWTPVTHARLGPHEGEPTDFFDVLRAGDVLVHHPYDSFATSTEAFIEQAAHDPKVLAIKLALYRTGPESPIVHALVEAAKTGKQVVALVELKARFDEQTNITWARVLEEAGVHVVYGIIGLKTHAKVALVVREENGVVRRYAHIGSGNYNPETAVVYEDLGLLTADAEIGADLTHLFNFLTGYSRQLRYEQLLVAPLSLRGRIVELIRSEARPGGRIVLKVNNLVDAEIVNELYAASVAGCRIDCIVRGICCLRPGIPGVSENIRVRSILGRFLEHSRVFRFGDEEDAAHYYIGSADLMPRNLDGRVEAVVPVTDRYARARLAEILAAGLDDDVQAWELDANGGWHRVETVVGVSSQRRLQELAARRTRAPEAAAGG